MARKLKDALLKKTTALPNAANTVSTTAIDLGAASPFPTSERFAVKLSTTTATGANNKNITVFLQASAEESANFTNIAGLGTLVAVDNNGAGYPAASLEVQLPPNTDKRYIRASATGEANGGNASNGTLAVELLF
jgi:hypothetical protein